MKPNAKTLAELTRAGNAAEDALDAVAPGDSDAETAFVAAEWLLTRRLPPWKFSIMVRAGSEPPPYDFKFKNLRGIQTDDRDRAYAWITAALLAGYGPMVHVGMNKSFAHGCGSIRDIRRRKEIEVEFLNRRKANVV